MNFRSMFGFLLALCLTVSVAWAQEETPAPETELTATFTAENGLTLQYPVEWVINERATYFYAASSEAALDKIFGEPFDAGEVQVGIFWGSVEDIISETDLGDDADLTEIMEAAITTALERGEARISTPERLSINDRRAETAAFSGEDFEGYATLIDFNDQFVGAQIITATGELEAWEPIYMQMLESITFDADGEVLTGETLPLTETYVDDDGLLSLDYPQGWATRSSYPPGVDLGSSEAALDLWLNHSFAPGDAHLSISYGTLDELFVGISSDIATAVGILEAAVANNEDDDIEISDIEPLTVNERPAAEIRLFLEESSIYFVVIEYEDSKFVAAQAQTNADELDAGETLLLRILATLEVDLASEG